MKKSLRLPTLLLAVITCVATISCSTTTEKAKNYTVKEVKGIKTYQNSVKPSGDPVSLDFKELFTIKAQNELSPDDTTLTFSSMGRIKTDSKGNIFILDNREFSVKKFDSKGKFLKRFGKQGNGPGELVAPYDMEVADDTIYVADNNARKMIRFDNEGNFVDNIFPPKGMPQMLTAVPGKKFMGILFGGEQKEDGLYMSYNLTLMNNKFEPLKQFSGITIKFDPQNFNNVDLVTHFCVNNNKEIFIAKNSEEDYKIDVYDYDGIHKYTINKNYRRVKYNKIELERYQNFVRRAFNDQLDVDTEKVMFKKTVRNLNYDEKNGYLIVAPSLERNDKNQNDYIVDIFKDGVFIKRHNFDKGVNSSQNLPAIARTFIKDKLFVSNGQELSIRVYQY